MGQNSREGAMTEFVMESIQGKSGVLMELFDLFPGLSILGKWN
jgi:hypothetical protein